MTTPNTSSSAELDAAERAEQSAKIAASVEAQKAAQEFAEQYRSDAPGGGFTPAQVEEFRRRGVGMDTLTRYAGAAAQAQTDLARQLAAREITLDEASQRYGAAAAEQAAQEAIQARQETPYGQADQRRINAEAQLDAAGLLTRDEAGNLGGIDAARAVRTPGIGEQPLIDLGLTDAQIEAAKAQSAAQIQLDRPLYQDSAGQFSLGLAVARGVDESVLRGAGYPPQAVEAYGRILDAGALTPEGLIEPIAAYRALGESPLLAAGLSLEDVAAIRQQEAAQAQAEQAAAQRQYDYQQGLALLDGYREPSGEYRLNEAVRELPTDFLSQYFPLDAIEQAQQASLQEARRSGYAARAVYNPEGSVMLVESLDAGLTPQELVLLTGDVAAVNEAAAYRRQRDAGLLPLPVPGAGIQGLGPEISQGELEFERAQTPQAQALRRLGAYEQRGGGYDLDAIVRDLPVDVPLTAGFTAEQVDAALERNAHADALRAQAERRESQPPTIGPRMTAISGIQPPYDEQPGVPRPRVLPTALLAYTVSPTEVDIPRASSAGLNDTLLAAGLLTRDKAKAAAGEGIYLPTVQELLDKGTFPNFALELFPSDSVTAAQLAATLRKLDGVVYQVQPNNQVRVYVTQDPEYKDVALRQGTMALALGAAGIGGAIGGLGGGLIVAGGGAPANIVGGLDLRSSWSRLSPTERAIYGALLGASVAGDAIVAAPAARASVAYLRGFRGAAAEVAAFASSPRQAAGIARATTDPTNIKFSIPLTSAADAAQRNQLAELRRVLTQDTAFEPPFHRPAGPSITTKVEPFEPPKSAIGGPRPVANPVELVVNPAAPETATAIAAAQAQLRSIRNQVVTVFEQSIAQKALAQTARNVAESGVKGVVVREVLPRALSRAEKPVVELVKKLREAAFLDSLEAASKGPSRRALGTRALATKEGVAAPTESRVAAMLERYLKARGSRLDPEKEELLADLVETIGLGRKEAELVIDGQRVRVPAGEALSPGEIPDYVSRLENFLARHPDIAAAASRPLEGKEIQKAASDYIKALRRQGVKATRETLTLARPDPDAPLPRLNTVVLESPNEAFTPTIGRQLTGGTDARLYGASLAPMPDELKIWYGFDPLPFSIRLPAASRAVAALPPGVPQATRLPTQLAQHEVMFGGAVTPESLARQQETLPGQEPLGFALPPEFRPRPDTPATPTVTRERQDLADFVRTLQERPAARAVTQTRTATAAPNTLEELIKRAPAKTLEELGIKTEAGGPAPRRAPATPLERQRATPPPERQQVKTQERERVDDEQLRRLFETPRKGTPGVTSPKSPAPTETPTKTPEQTRQREPQRTRERETTTTRAPERQRPRAPTPGRTRQREPQPEITTMRVPTPTPTRIRTPWETPEPTPRPVPVPFPQPEPDLRQPPAPPRQPPKPPKPPDTPAPRRPEAPTRQRPDLGLPDDEEDYRQGDAILIVGWRQGLFEPVVNLETGAVIYPRDIAAIPNIDDARASFTPLKFGKGNPKPRKIDMGVVDAIVKPVRKDGLSYRPDYDQRRKAKAKRQPKGKRAAKAAAPTIRKARKA